MSGTRTVSVAEMWKSSLSVDIVLNFCFQSPWHQITLCTTDHRHLIYTWFCPCLCSLWPATVFNGPGPHLACGLLITWEWQTFCGFRGQHRKHVWVLNKAVVKRELLDTVKARELAYYGHTTRKQGSCLEKEIMQGTMPGARRRGRPRTAWMDNIKTWTGLPVEESIKMTEGRDKWRKYVHGVANPRIEHG